MSPIAHAVISYALRHKMQDVVVGALPDVANPFFMLTRQHQPEGHPLVLISRILHSPLTLLALLIVGRLGGIPAADTRPYWVHWGCDALTHPAYQWGWPMVRRSTLR